VTSGIKGRLMNKVAGAYGGPYKTKYHYPFTFTFLVL
jgi:hypothetical protein